MDDNLGYLFAAFAVTWLMIAGYLYYMNTQIRTLREDIEDFEKQVTDKQ
jgi:CcmD family protein